MREGKKIAISDDELVGQLAEVLTDLVAEGHLELASKRAAAPLAGALSRAIEAAPELDVAEWLLDRDEVSELYVENEEIADRLRPLFRRMSDGDPAPQHHAGLLAAIAGAPGFGDLDAPRTDEERQARVVYADWLVEQGDPRGELMALQLQQGDPNTKRALKSKLEARIRSLMATHRTHFFGDLTLDATVSDHVQAELVLGFFDQVLVVDEHNLRTLLTLESSRLLRVLTINVPRASPVDSLLAETPLPATLRALEITSPETSIGRVADDRLDLGRATRGLDHLVRLKAQADNLHLDVAPPRLRTLDLTAKALHVGSGWTLGELRHLEIAAARISGGLRDLFREPPETLEEVSLSKIAADGLAGELVKALAVSAVAQSLRSLTLEGSNLGDDVAAAIMEMRGLSEVRVVGDAFSPTMTAAILERFPGSGVGYDDRYEDIDE